MATNEGCKALYVGNLDSRVTDYMLYEIFSVVGQVDNVKIIMDRNVSKSFTPYYQLTDLHIDCSAWLISLQFTHAQYQHGGMNYGFVEFVDHLSAEQALLAMNGRKIFSSVRTKRSIDWYLDMTCNLYV